MAVGKSCWNWGFNTSLEGVEISTQYVYFLHAIACVLNAWTGMNFALFGAESLLRHLTDSSSFLGGRIGKIGALSWEEVTAGVSAAEF